MLRRCAEQFVLIVIAAIIFRTWAVVGGVIPMRVAGASMAESYLGQHFEIRCGDCAFSFPIDATTGQPSRPLRCPNCGNEQDFPDELPQMLGDRLYVDRLIFEIRKPRRWEPVVFRCPSAPSTYCIKRIVGLPGETVSIDDGDVIIDGKVARKSLTEFRRLALLVHDSAYQARNNDNQNVLPSNLYDGYSYNHRLSRQLNELQDKLIEVRIRCKGSGVLALTARYHSEEFLLELCPEAGTGTLSQNGNVVDDFSVGSQVMRDDCTLYFAAVDGSILFGINGDDLLEYEIATRRAYASIEKHSTIESRLDAAIAIGADELDIEISNMKLLRDVFYTQLSSDHGTMLPRKLRPGEYFVLGDNSPISQDSRHGDDQVLYDKYILGKPLGAGR
jgi:signal peptidase I